MFHHKVIPPIPTKTTKSTPLLPDDEQTLQHVTKKPTHCLNRTSSALPKLNLSCSPRCVLLSTPCSSSEGDDWYAMNASPTDTCMDTSTFLNASILFSEQCKYLYSLQLEERRQDTRFLGCGIFDHPDEYDSLDEDDDDSDIPVTLTRPIAPKTNTVNVPLESFEEKMSRFFKDFDHTSSVTQWSCIDNLLFVSLPSCLFLE